MTGLPEYLHSMESCLVSEAGRSSHGISGMLCCPRILKGPDGFSLAACTAAEPLLPLLWRAALPLLSPFMVMLLAKDVRERRSFVPEVVIKEDAGYLPADLTRACGVILQARAKIIITTQVLKVVDYVAAEIFCVGFSRCG